MGVGVGVGVGVAELLVAGIWSGADFDAAMEGAQPADVEAVLALASHEDAEVRTGVVMTLPLMAGGDPQSTAMVDVAVALTADTQVRVRDWACFALAEQWREADTPSVREALAAHLADEDDDVRCEALVGLAYRGDQRALPAVRAALSRPSGDLRRLELVAAGALGDPDLHELVRRHLQGWDEEDELVVEAVRRSTDPAGIGQDVFEGVAALYRGCGLGPVEATAETSETGVLDEREGLAAWRQLIAVLDLRPGLAGRCYQEVAALLVDDPAGLAELSQNSALAQMAGVINGDET